MSIISKYFLSSICFLLYLPVFVFAGEDATAIPVKLDNPLLVDSLEEFLIAILKLVMILMVPVMVFFIILAGFKYVTARGNATTIQEATKALTYAIIGAVIILGAVAISEMIESTVDEFKAKPTALMFISTTYI